MARSSGGGSRSGGSRSSSSSSRSSSSRGGGGNGIRTSSRPFKNSRKFRYYRNGVAYYVYSDRDLTAMKDAKPRYFMYLFYLPFFAAILGLWANVVNIPEKPMETYNSAYVQVLDEADVFTGREETSLQNKLEEFGEKTGITTQLITVKPEEWHDNGSFEDYAFYRYYAQFDNEDSWLLTYSEEDNGAGEWYWEGVQGDNTFDTMDVFLDDFNTILHSQLVVNQTADPARAFTKAFDKSIDLFENQTAKIKWGEIGLPIAVTAFILFHSSVFVFAGTRKKFKYSELEEIKNDPVIEAMKQEETARQYPQKEEELTCPFCGFSYKNPQNNRCPNCGALITE